MSANPEPVSRLPEAILAELEAAVRGLPVEDVPAVVGRLAAAQATALLRLAEAGRGIGADRLVDINEAAELLSVTKSWLYEHHGELPFTVRSGRSLRFSRAGIDRFIKRGGKRAVR